MTKAALEPTGRAKWLRLDFEGWFQARLATDPDPTDEPRGVSGTTFALAGEPDFDKIIRFQRPPKGTVRPCTPRVGVTVRQVSISGRPAPPDHPLRNARVNLLNEPWLYSRNRILGSPGQEPIDPIHLEVKGKGITFARRTFLDPSNPTMTPWEASAARLLRHAPTSITMNDPEAGKVTGIVDYRGYRTARLDALRRVLADEEDPVARVALEKRIAEIVDSLRHQDDRRIGYLAVVQTFDLPLSGPMTLSRGYERRLGARVRPQDTWPFTFWMGTWDCDALCGYSRGHVSVPLLSYPRQ